MAQTRAGILPSLSVNSGGAVEEARSNLYNRQKCRADRKLNRAV